MFIRAVYKVRWVEEKSIGFRFIWMVIGHGLGVGKKGKIKGKEKRHHF